MTVFSLLKKLNFFPFFHVHFFVEKIFQGISEVGIVENVDENGIMVRYKTLEEALLFPHDVLSKVSVL